MKRSFCRAKISDARVTKVQVEYEGSCGIDAEVLQAAGIAPFEWILVIDTANANRFETYAIAEKAGSGEIALYGGAAKLAKPGDELIILCLGYLDEAEAKSFSGPRIVRLLPGNKLG
jgi:aspartate 1-decarboxylase